MGFILVVRLIAVVNVRFIIVHKYVWTKRTLIFKDMVEVTVHVKCYRCVECGKTFSTNLSKIVMINANFIDDFRDGMREIFAKLFFL